MTELPRLNQLSDVEKDALIRGLWEEQVKLRAEQASLREQLSALQGKRKRPKKTSKNSSLPPAKGFKATVKTADASSSESTPRRGHGQGGRELSASPTQVVTAKAKVCSHCGEAVLSDSQALRQVYERIDLPPIEPVVTRVDRYGGTCSCCGEAYLAPVPVGLEPGSPFGASIETLVSYLRYGHAISYERLRTLVSDLFGLSISEGGIANLLQRVNEKLQAPVAAIYERLQQSRLVCSDETGARVNGKPQWEWVFQNEDVCLHLIRPSRSGAVISEVFGPKRPQIWVSDLYSAQRTHGAQQWQMCLAHQLRDCQYAIDSGDDLFAPRMKQLLLKAIAIDRRRHQLAASTLAQYRSCLRGGLREILNLKPKNADGQRLVKRYRALRESILLFLDEAAIPPTNNSSEQALRWSVVFRKVTHGFRSDWGSDLFAQVRSIVNTGKRQGMSALEAIARAIMTPHAFCLGG